MPRSTISDAALADENLLRIAEWCEAWGAMWSVMPVDTRREGAVSRVVVTIRPGVGGGRLPWERPLDAAEGSDPYRAGSPEANLRGATHGEAYGRAVDFLSNYARKPEVKP